MSHSKVTLEVVTGPHQGELREFDEHSTLLVGRAEEAQLRLPQDLHFSRNHFRVEVKPPQCHLVDLDSSNGTFVNGRRVSDVWLRNGDTISGGKTQIIVRIDGLDDEDATQIHEFDMMDLEGFSKVEDPLPSVPDYEILRELGRGSMGIVYHARCNKTGDEVALKLVKSDVDLTESATQAFIREGRVLSKLKHKRIVKFVDTGTTDGRLFLAMEYVPAIDLERTLAKLTFSERVRLACGIVRQILGGLDYAHQKNMVHRDVKPKNVLVARRSTGYSAKLADFGLAKNFMDVGLSQISGENEIKGTLCFMAPEQVVNCRFARPEADIYGAGATLYTLISGETIYDLSDHRTPLAAVLNGGPIPIGDRVEIDPDLAAVIMKSLAHESEDRFASASEMRSALQPFCV